MGIFNSRLMNIIRASKVNPAMAYGGYTGTLGGGMPNKFSNRVNTANKLYNQYGKTNQPISAIAPTFQNKWRYSNTNTNPNQLMPMNYMNTIKPMANKTVKRGGTGILSNARVANPAYNQKTPNTRALVSSYKNYAATTPTSTYGRRRALPI